MDDTGSPGKEVTDAVMAKMDGGKVMRLGATEWGKEVGATERVW